MQLAQFSIIILVRYPKSPNVSGPVGCVDLKSVSIYSGCPGWTNLCWKVKVWNPFYCQQDKLRETHHLVFKTALRRRCIFTIYAFREFVYKNTKRKEAKRNKNYEQNVNNNNKKKNTSVWHLKSWSNYYTSEKANLNHLNSTYCFKCSWWHVTLVPAVS